MDPFRTAAKTLNPIWKMPFFTASPCYVLRSAIDTGRQLVYSLLKVYAIFMVKA
jgi:hypothetical protein